MGRLKRAQVRVLNLGSAVETEATTRGTPLAHARSYKEGKSRIASWTWILQSRRTPLAHARSHYLESRSPFRRARPAQGLPHGREAQRREPACRRCQYADLNLSASAATAVSALFTSVASRRRRFPCRLRGRRALVEMRCSRDCRPGSGTRCSASAVAGRTAPATR